MNKVADPESSKQYDLFKSLSVHSLPQHIRSLSTNITANSECTHVSNDLRPIVDLIKANGSQSSNESVFLPVFIIYIPRQGTDMVPSAGTAVH